MNNTLLAVYLIAILGTMSTNIEAKMFPLPIRLNNPGALKITQDHWNGAARLQTDKKLVRFLTPQAGLRAMMKTLLTYEDLYRITTINLIINRYAPPSENNTEYYINDVSTRMGFPSNLFIDLSKIDNLIDLSKAIVMHENGNSPSNMPINWYEEATYHAAAVDALNGAEE